MTCLLSLLLLVVLSAPASAQSASFPSFVVGDEWTRTNGLVTKVVKVDGDTTAMNGINLNCKTCVYYLGRNFATLKVEEADGKPANVGSLGFQALGPEWKFYDWPLEVGKTWSFFGSALFRNNAERHSYVNTIESYEDVVTKAGTFKAFKIRRDVSVHNSNRGATNTWTATWWYAPAAKGTVKFTSTNPNQPEWELSAYTVK